MAHEAFCFCLLEIHPLILAKVQVVDLSLSSEEIQELMLTRLLQPECEQWMIQHLQLQNDKQFLQDQVVAEEVRSPGAIYRCMCIDGRFHGCATFSF